MSSPSDTVYIADTAVAADGPQLLEILEEQPFGGAISLLYTRRPDPYASLLQEGEEVEIIVGREQPGSRICGMGACSINTVYLDGEPRKAGYLHSLRVRPAYRGRPWIQRGYQHLLRDPAGRGISLFFTTILEENLDARRLLEKRRRSMPVYELWDRYVGCAVLTGRSPGSNRGRGRPGDAGRNSEGSGARTSAGPAAGSRGDRRTFRAAAPGDRQGLREFLAREGPRNQLFPVASPGEGARSGASVPPLADFRLLLDIHGEILAAGALWDQRDRKQHVVAGYRGPYRMVRPLSFALPLLGFPRLPKPGSALNFAALSFWAVKDDDPEVFLRFLAGMRAAGASHDFLFLGLSKRHPLLECLRRVPHFEYGSLLYTVRYEHQRLVEPGPRRLPYLEIGRL